MSKITTCFLLIVSSVVWAGSNLEHVDSEARRHYIERAQVWSPVDVPNRDILAGPQNEISAPLETEVTCTYVEWKEPPTGVTPKFKCSLVDSGAIVHVKFGQETREIYAEPAATRLFWALGFYADDMYPVQIHCLRCPEKNAFHPKKKERRIEGIFRDAVMERNYDGFIIEEKKNQGWAWAELENVDPKKGGANRAEIDALKLLGVFIQHGDNRPEQQRLGCAPDDVQNGNCVKPVLMVDDLGATFGRAGYRQGTDGKMNFDKWSHTPIWDRSAEADYFSRTKRHVCIGNITGSQLSGEKGLNKPVISEAGRRFLAGLMNQLSDQQIDDLFRVARADRTGEVIMQDGRSRRVTIEDWALAFKKKREEIDERTCPQ